MALTLTLLIDGVRVRLDDVGLWRAAVARNDLRPETQVLLHDGRQEVYSGPASAVDVLAALFAPPKTPETRLEGSNPPATLAGPDGAADQLQQAQPAPSDPVSEAWIAQAPAWEAPPTGNFESHPRSGRAPPEEGPTETSPRLWVALGLALVAFAALLAAGLWVWPRPFPVAATPPAAATVSAPAVRVRAQQAPPPPVAGPAAARTVPPARPRPSDTPPERAVPPKTPAINRLMASFPCDRAKAWDEVTLCSSPQLARADRLLGQTYQALRRSLSGEARTRLAAEEGAWLAQRRACRQGADPPACMLDRTIDRLNLLRARQRTPSVAPSLPAPAPPPPVVVSPRQLTTPVWDRGPRAEDVDRYYPRRALGQGLAGDARLKCVASPDRSLSCAVSNESKRGYGFGDAALKVFEPVSLSSRQADGALRAGDWFYVRVQFGGDRGR